MHKHKQTHTQHTHTHINTTHAYTQVRTENIHINRYTKHTHDHKIGTQYKHARIIKHKSYIKNTRTRIEQVYTQKHIYKPKHTHTTYKHNMHTQYMHTQTHTKHEAANTTNIHTNNINTH